MQRREALKKIGLTTGFVIATPTLISLFQSCTDDTQNWVPQFFSEEQATVLTDIVDVFLPKTDIPSATEVNVPQFMDKYVNEVWEPIEQDRIKVAFDKLLRQIKTDYNENLNKVTEDNYKDLLDNHMLIVPKGQEPTPETEPMTTSDLLNSIKWMAINGYKINETVGETILAYDPIPSTSYCGDLQELTGGRAWSL